MKKQNNFKLVFSIALFIVIIDQLSKFLVRSKFLLNESKQLIPKVLELTRVENTGIAFGLLKDLEIVMIIISVLIIGAIIYYLKEVKNRNLCIFLSLILGGAFGNLIDRVFYGTITDFIKINIWPVFNIADSCITIGAVLLIVYFLRKENNSKN